MIVQLTILFFSFHPLHVLLNWLLARCCYCHCLCCCCCCCCCRDVVIYTTAAINSPRARVGILYLFVLYIVFNLHFVYFYILSGEGSKQHKKYIEFDTKHYTRKSKFSVFWKKNRAKSTLKKYMEFPRVKRV